MFHDLTTDQQAHTLAMGEISEASYSAGWMLGLEYALWQLLETGKSAQGRYHLSEEERQKLRVLSERCGGWIAFDDQKGETFVPFSDWRSMFETNASEYLDTE